MFRMKIYFTFFINFYCIFKNKIIKVKNLKVWTFNFKIAKFWQIKTNNKIMKNYVCTVYLFKLHFYILFY